VPEPAL
jgi:hypothetical protein